MKHITEQLKTWASIEERIRTLNWARNTFIAPKLAESIAVLRAECGFNDASRDIQKAWALFEAQISLAEAAEILLHLRSLGALVEHFIEAYQSPEGGAVQKALSLLNPRKTAQTIQVLRIEWRN